MPYWGRTGNRNLACKILANGAHLYCTEEYGTIQHHEKWHYGVDIMGWDPVEHGDFLRFLYDYGKIAVCAVNNQ